MTLRQADTLGKRLTYFRELQGLSIAALARLVGIARPSMSQFESGGHMPTAARVQQLAQALGIHPGDLFPPEWCPRQRKVPRHKLKKVVARV